MKKCPESIYARVLEADDFAQFYEVVSNEEVMRYALMSFDSEAEARKVYNEFLYDENMFFYGVYTGSETTVDTATFIGIGLILIDCKSAGGEIGYFLFPDYWGRGYGYRLAEMLCEICFNEMGLHKVFAICNVNNHASENIMKKLGMQREGVIRHARHRNGTWEDEYFYGILKDEWHK